MRRWCLLACACLASLGPARAQGTAAEAEVMAAVVFNLLAFVQWPGEEGAAERQLVLCSLEGSALEATLQRYQVKTVHGLPLGVRRIAGGPDESRHCQAVVVEAGNFAALARFAALAAHGQPLLVIGEGPHAVDNGAMIGLDASGGRVALDVDAAALRRARLAASSKLLRLARNLRE